MNPIETKKVEKQNRKTGHQIHQAKILEIYNVITNIKYSENRNGIFLNMDNLNEEN